ncbi:MAG: alpha-L-fucosidase [Actinobacteria bacterium]|nr:alpha-L-fucosidase [Actinomycetota bacterium]
MSERYEATWESVSTHPLPDWYDDAKLGIFLHWGLYSIPGWGPQVADIQQLLKSQGPEGMLKNNPYAEWYRNTMQIHGSPTQRHHAETYGADFPYDGFIPRFDESAGAADLDAIASLCRAAGAGYVVLTTKHHEGFPLWPTAVYHPTKTGYQAKRDLVHDMTEAVRRQGMRMGLYYSGGYDWSFNNTLIRQAADTMLAVPADEEYQAYATAHVRELIDRYQPSVLWNDIAWPPGGDLAELFAHYYNVVPDGVVNDRWLQPGGHRGPVSDALARSAGRIIQLMWHHIPEQEKSLTFPTSHWYDFRTPEYQVFDGIQEKKWEATRGVGHSFGANRNERTQDIVTPTELIHLLVDVVSKNGNLLIGVGPDDQGGIPEQQQLPLRGLGEWMQINGAAIRGSRPWTTPQTVTSDGCQVRFVSNGGHVQAFILDPNPSATVTIAGLDADSVTDVRLVGYEGDVEVAPHGRDLEIRLPDRFPQQAAITLDLGPMASMRT